MICPRRLAPLLVVVLACLPALLPGADDVYRLTVRATYETTKSFTYIHLLDRSTGEALRSDPVREIKPILLECRKALAKKLGYQPQIYGPDFHTYVAVQKYRYEMSDLRTGRVVLEENR